MIGEGPQEIAGATPPEAGPKTFETEASFHVIAKEGKPQNQSGDKVYVNRNGSVVLLDGAGGLGGDFVAARVGGHRLNQKLKELSARAGINETFKAMLEGFSVAGKAIREERAKPDAPFKKMDATAVAVKIASSPDGMKRFAVIGWIGDSPGWIGKPDGSYKEITHDHSAVQRLVDLGIIGPFTAELHPERYLIYRSLSDVPETFQEAGEIVGVRVVELGVGDTVVLQSDGVRDNLGAAEQKRLWPEYQELVRQGQADPRKFANRLAETANKKVELLSQSPLTADLVKEDDISAAQVAPKPWKRSLPQHGGWGFPSIS